MNQVQDIPQEVTRALKDAGFRNELFKSKDPKDKLERKLGLTLPQGVKVGARQGDREAELLARVRARRARSLSATFYSATVTR